MKTARLSKLLTFLIFLCLFLFYADNAFACLCYGQTPCQAYSQSKSVFIGKLEKLEEEIDNARLPRLVGYFSVEKTFKGSTEKLEKVKFNICFDAPKFKFKVGEKYFVYKEDAEANHYCNRTEIFHKESFDLKYAEGLSKTNPAFTIGGVIQQLSEEELKRTAVWVKEGQNKHKIKVDKSGWEYKATRKGSYSIEIILPLDAEIRLTSSYRGVQIGYSEEREFTVTKSSRQTIIEYELQFKSNECDFRTVEFERIINRTEN